MHKQHIEEKMLNKVSLALDSSAKHKATSSSIPQRAEEKGSVLASILPTQQFS